MPVFLPGEFHEETSLVGYSPRGHKELDTTERLTDIIITIICLMNYCIFLISHFIDYSMKGN